jgi:hypothetical protein
MHALLLVMLLLQTPTPTARGVVSRRILGLDGLPAVGIRVTATVAAPPRAADAAVITNIAQTNDQGRYRLENIPPGKYFITAGLLDLPTYYPGVLDAAKATVLTIATGDSTADIDFAMQRGTGARITGRLAVLPTLKRSTPHVLELTSLENFTFLSAQLREDGTFEFPKVRPGTYNLRMLLGLTGGMTVDVGDTDVTLVLGAGPGVRVIGKLTMTGATPGAPLATTPVFLNLGSGSPAYVTESDTDGAFEFPRVPPGTYFVYSRANPNDRMSIVVADKDVTGVALTLPFTMQIPGRLVVENGVAPREWRLEARLPSGSFLWPQIAADGSFMLRTTGGTYEVVIANPQTDYAIRSMRYGTLDLTKAPLTVKVGDTIEEIRIVVGTK